MAASGTGLSFALPLSFATGGLVSTFFFFTLNGFGPFGPFFFFRGGSADVEGARLCFSEPVGWRACSSRYSSNFSVDPMVKGSRRQHTYSLLWMVASLGGSRTMTERLT
jgi:hypothetical protein